MVCGGGGGGVEGGFGIEGCGLGRGVEDELELPAAGICGAAAVFGAGVGGLKRMAKGIGGGGMFCFL